MLGGETWIGGVLELLVTWMQLILDHSIVNNNFWSGREQTRDSEGTFMLSFICTTRISDHQLNSANRSPLFTFSGLLGQNLKSKWQEWTPAEEPSHCSFLLKTLFYSDFFFFLTHTFSIMQAVFPLMTTYVVVASSHSWFPNTIYAICSLFILQPAALPLNTSWNLGRNSKHPEI